MDSLMPFVLVVLLTPVAEPVNGEYQYAKEYRRTDKQFPTKSQCEEFIFSDEGKAYLNSFKGYNRAEPGCAENPEYMAYSRRML